MPMSENSQFTNSNEPDTEFTKVILFKQIKKDRKCNIHLVAPELKAGVVCVARQKFTSLNLHCKYNSKTN